MRRKDREVTNISDILSILDRCHVMCIGLCHDNKPYIVPMNFAYEVKDGVVLLWFHCATEGKKLDIIEKNNNVCFEADCSGELETSDIACEWSFKYESVMGEGEISVLNDDTSKITALDAIMKKYGFQGTPQYNPSALSAVKVLQIRVSEISGKRRF